MAVLNVELINDLNKLKEEADKLEEQTERRKKLIVLLSLPLKEEEQNLKEELKKLEKIKEKINSIQEEKKEENEPLTRQQIKEININDLLKVNNIFYYSRFWQTSEDDADKFKIIKITNNFIMAKKLKKEKKEHLGGSGGYAYYKCILREDDEEKYILKIAKSSLDSYYFFKDGLRYELNKDFQLIEDNGR
jgi:hypothetical protein